MKKENISTLLKWVTVAILGLSLVLFICPYVFIDGENYNPIKMLQEINENKDYIRSDAMFETIIVFIIPMVLTFISAIIMIFRISIPKCVICVILNIISILLYYALFTISFLDVNGDNIKFGLIGNIIIAVLGIILPIVNIVVKKVFAKNKN